MPLLRGMTMVMTESDSGREEENFVKEKINNLEFQVYYIAMCVDQSNDYIL